MLILRIPSLSFIYTLQTYIYHYIYIVVQLVMALKMWWKLLYHFRKCAHVPTLLHYDFRGYKPSSILPVLSSFPKLVFS